MTGDKVKAVCDMYLQWFTTGENAGGVRLSEEQFGMRNHGWFLVARDHIVWMAAETKRLVDAGRLEKAFRWLGFIQGWLWAEGYYSIDDLKMQNMELSE